MQGWSQSTLQAQFANSPILFSILDSFNDAADPSGAVDSFYANIWDIDSARGYGLDVWGRIVGVSRVLQIPGGAGGPVFGFSQAEGGGAIDTFGVAPFSSSLTATTNYNLPDDQYRTLIMVKALANITGCSIQALNRLLLLVFPGSGNAYVIETGAMAITYHFDFPLSTVQLAIVTQSGAIPHPTGVAVTITHA